VNLKKKSQLIRRHIMRALFHAQAGHCGGALSCVELMAVLYFHHMRLNPSRPDWSDRDRFILSKGHGCLALYAALAEKGYFPVDKLNTFDDIDGVLQGHPDIEKTPGIDMSTGSLGQGLSAGIGMAIGAKIGKKDFHTYVLLGDGEVQSGQVWEAAMAAPHYRLGNLTAIIDRNKLQLVGDTEETMPLEPLREKWEDFGWKVIEGKGISFMEDEVSWHSKPMSEDEFNKAMEELNRVSI
jgi:transketolase